MKKLNPVVLILLFIFAIRIYASENSDYVVEQPGTITFKQGVKIVGKVEKPQVTIFLPKEKSYYKKISFDHSFAEDISKPLDFDPIIK